VPRLLTQREAAMSTDKKTKPALPEKTETEILYPTIKVGQYDIEPWGMCEIAKIVPYIYAAKAKLKAAGVSFSLDKLEELPLILPHVIDEILNILAITVGVSVDEIKAVKPKTLTIEMTLKVAWQNIGYLKNSLGLLDLVTNSIKA